VTRMEKSIEIMAPPEKVWEMLALDRWPEWMEGWKNAKYTSKVDNPRDKYTVGASAHIVGPEEFDAEITESLENEKFTFHGKVPRMSFSITSILESVDEGTKFTHVIDAELPWGVFGKFLGRLTRGMGEKEAKKSIEKLKSILEK
jgi:carbon monoxide dehydrogenase subunit G